VRDYITEISSRPFDLKKGPLFRFVLITEKDNRHFLSITLHHLISDGISMTVLVREITQVYNALRDNRTVGLEPLERQFLDCIIRPDEAGAGQGFARARQFWQARLSAGALNVVFPGVRAKAPDFMGTKMLFSFPASVRDWVQEISSSNRVTPFMTLLGLTFALLRTVTGQEEIVIVTDISGRDRKEYENQIGCFIQSLILKMQVGDGSFVQLVQDVRSAFLEALHHMEYSFEHIVRDPVILKGRRPLDLLNVLVLYRDFHPELDLKGAVCRGFEPEIPGSLTDIQFEFLADKVGLALTITYNTGLFDPEQILRLKAFFDQLIGAVQRSGDAPLHSLDVLPAEERRLIAGEFSPGPLVDVSRFESVVGLFERQVRMNPQKAAVFYKDGQLSFRELEERANQLARYLRRFRGCKRGSRIVVLLDRSDEAVIAVLAILKAGMVYIPFDVNWPAGRINAVIDRCRPDAILSTSASVAETDGALHNGIIWLDRIGNELSQLSGEAIGEQPEAGDEAYIIYTSGTEGLPKGVVVGHGALSDYVHAFNSYFGINECDIILQQASLAFDTSMEEIFPVLTSGGSIVVHPGGGRDVEGMLDLIDRFPVSILSTVPLVIKEINRQAWRVEKLRCLISGGDRLKRDYVDKFSGAVRLYNTYGPTEATIYATVCPVGFSGDSIPIGKPIAGKRIYILNEKLQPQPIGCPGEIFIGGSGLALGYLDDEAETDRKFIKDPFIDEGRIYRTGDYGRWLADGNIEYIGRRDDQLKVFGCRVELKEVEKALMRHPEITDVMLTT
jgi:amino acid adenylation domain-containing protein